MSSSRFVVRGVVAGVAMVASSLAPGLFTGAGAAAPPSQVWTWGANGFGQLGNGAPSATPSRAAEVAGLSDIIDVHGGREHVVALSSSGTIYTWGSNVEGQLGLGDSTNRSRPTVVPSPCGTSKVTAVETGHNSTLALCESGAVWAWGLNADGQLGNGTRTLSRSPVRVLGLTDAVAIAAGRDMAYAIRAGGTMVAWGDNAFGELGDGTLTDRSAPVAVASLTGVTAIAGGRNHALALRTDGSVWAFGANTYGQVGDGTSTYRTTPVRVGNLTGVSDVAAGAHHSYALASDGRVLSWGRNYRAQLGNGSLDRPAPVVVQGVTGAVSIGSGRDHGVAVLGSGAAVSWGNNAQGQLGDGTTTTRSSAVPVLGVAGAAKAGGGGAEYSVILAADGGTPPPNSAPVASFTSSCSGLTCTFDGTASTDSDGSVVAYRWSFGDGTQSNAAATTSHAFAAAGTYTVSLVVTDDDGATGERTQQVTVSVASPTSVTYKARAVFDGNAITPSVLVPAGVTAQDQLLLFVSTNLNGTATTPTGWTLLSTVVDGVDLRSWVFTRTGLAAGARASVSLDVYGKTNLTLLAYSGTGQPSAVGAAEAGTSATHRTPAATVAAAGSTVVSFWTDKVNTAHGWTLPANVTSRGATVGTGSGMLTTAAGDTAAVGASQWPGAAATAGGVTSSKAVGWTVVLPPA
jgi:alpha-tubulin suppressor-like RCC1 family protein